MTLTVNAPDAECHNQHRLSGGVDVGCTRDVVLSARSGLQALAASGALSRDDRSCTGLVRAIRAHRKFACVSSIPFVERMCGSASGCALWRSLLGGVVISSVGRPSLRS